jgi:hypothetical protein
MRDPASWPPASRGERPLPETLRNFLLDSEQRVLWHCQNLLAQDLPADERQRLLRLTSVAEKEVARLAGLTAIRAA